MLPRLLLLLGIPLLLSSPAAGVDGMPRGAAAATNVAVYDRNGQELGLLVATGLAGHGGFEVFVPSVARIMEVLGGAIVGEVVYFEEESCEGQAHADATDAPYLLGGADAEAGSPRLFVAAIEAPTSVLFRSHLHAGTCTTRSSGELRDGMVPAEEITLEELRLTLPFARPFQLAPARSHPR